MVSRSQAFAFIAWSLVLPHAAFTQCKVTELKLLGEPGIMLENSLVRLRIQPTRGGRVDQFFYKLDDKWLTSRSDGRVFVDRLWNYADNAVYRQWTEAVYAYKIERGKDEAAVILTCRGSIGIGSRLTFKKRISLRTGDASVRADYELGLAHEAMVPKPAGIWWHNRLGVPQEATTYFVPTKSGIQTLTYGAGAAGQYWWYDLPRGWAAALGEEGTGVATVMDDRKLMCVYHLLRGEAGLMEWAYRSENIPNGEGTKTTIWLVPFGGLKSVSGAGSDVVGEIVAPEKLTPAEGKDVPVTIKLTAPRAWKARVRLTSQKLPDGEIREIETWSAALSNEAVSKKKIRIELDEGSHKLRAEILRGDELAADLITATVVGKASGELVITPLRKPLGRLDERFEHRIAAKEKVIEDVPPSEEVVTPHVKWAKPLAAGKLKTLILNDVLIERETIELAQRVEMDYAAPTVGSYRGIRNARLPSRGLTFEQAQANVARLLNKDYDAVVVGGVRGSLFTDASAETLLAKVRDGMGLVCVNPNNFPKAVQGALPFQGGPFGSRAKGQWKATEDHFLTRGIPWDAMPSVDISRYKMKDGKVLANAGDVPLLVVKEFGKGRIVCLTYATSWQGPGFHKNGITPWVQFAPTRFDYWEYYFSLLAKCLVWAGKGEPEVSVTGRYKPGKIELTISNAGEPVDVKVRLPVQDEHGRRMPDTPVTSKKFVTVKPGENRLELPLPKLSGGLHLADAIIEDRKGAKIDWTTIPIRIQAPVMIQLDVPDNVYRQGETVTAKLVLKSTDQAPSFYLHSTLTDSNGRIIWREESKAAPGKMDFSFRLPEPLTTTAVLRVEVRDNQAPQSHLHAAEQKILTMPPAWDRREWGPYLSGLWGNPAGAYSREYLVKHQAGQVKAAGIDAVMTTGRWTLDGEQRQPFEMGLRTIPIGMASDVLSPSKRRGEYLSFKDQKSQYLRTGDKKFLVRPWCLNAAESKAHVAKKIKTALTAAARYKPIGYICGDELSVTDHIQPFDYDFGPPALAAFREWLKKEYGQLSSLNKTWATQFTDWNSVMPMTAKEVAHRGNYAPWADHRTFMDVSLEQFLDYVDTELEKYDPGARIGTSGTQAAAAYGGHDWWRLTRAFDFIQAYDHQNTGEMQRSFNEMLTGSWWGYYTHGPGLQHQLWRRMLNGNRGAFYFATANFMHGDFNYSRTAREGTRYIMEFKNGLVRLLYGCERVTDVYIHYSQPSIQGSFITGGENEFKNNRAGWFKMIEDAGMQAQFLSYQQVEQGELSKLMPKVFILPYSVALSDAEANELRKYVEAGGTLIADARCGLFDEHCSPRKAGALDHVFGVTRTEINPKAKRIHGEVVFTKSYGECDPRNIKFEDQSGEPGIKITNGESLGQIAERPILTINKAGKGKAVLLNLFVGSYPRKRKSGTGQPLRQLINEVFDLAGVKPFAKAGTSDSEKFYLARYRSGDANYIAVLREPANILTGGGPGGATTGKAPKPSAVTVNFAETAHAYDLRDGKYLGKTDRSEKQIDPGNCRVISLLPYRVRSVSVSLDEKTVGPGGDVRYSVNLKARFSKPGFHVFRIEVTAPDGARDWYGTQLTAADGQAESSFKLALNDIPGKWQIKATDIATGMSGEARFTIKR